MTRAGERRSCTGRAVRCTVFAVVFVAVLQLLLPPCSAKQGGSTIQHAPFYQRVSIASYASAGIARAEMSVCPSVTLRYCIKTKKASVMISSPSESLNILVSRNIWLITKFDRGHPERGRFLRLGWVRSGDFGDISTNKPPYLRNGAR